MPSGQPTRPYSLISGLVENLTPGPTTIEPYSVIAKDTVWGPQGSPYLLPKGVSVGSGSTLTLLPGTVVKLGVVAGYENISLTIQGALYALGTPDNPVVITSMRDDSVMGDSNGDGAATVPARGDWTEVSVGYPGAVGYLDYVDVRYGGNYPGGRMCVGAGSIGARNDTQFVLSNSRITESATGGVVLTHSTEGYGGVFNNEFDTSACGGISSVDGPAMVIGNTFKSGIEGPSWYSLLEQNFTFRYNVAAKPIRVTAPQANVDTRFNTLSGGVESGTFPGNWYGHDINTEVLPPCMTRAELDAHIPKLATGSFIGCPMGMYKPEWASTVLPALSGPPPAVPESILEASAAGASVRWTPRAGR